MDDALPTRATSWALRTRTLHFGHLPKIMGIVNVTPDSFSDGGLFPDADAAVSHALQLVDHGATIVDVGGESTRPNARAVPASEELERVLPVIESVASRTDVIVSVDTSKAVVAQACLDAGAEIINDVTGFEGDPDMAAVLANSGAGACIMHMQGTPRTMQHNPVYADVVDDITSYLAERIDALVTAGVNPQQLCVDPGIGFGKTLDHNVTLLREVARFHGLGVPLLVGHSRKSFLGTLLGDVHLERDAASVGVTLSLARQDVQVVRVHDVAATHRALTTFAAVGGLDHN